MIASYIIKILVDEQHHKGIEIVLELVIDSRNVEKAHNIVNISINSNGVQLVVILLNLVINVIAVEQHVLVQRLVVHSIKLDKAQVLNTITNDNLGKVLNKQILTNLVVLNIEQLCGKKVQLEAIT